MVEAAKKKWEIDTARDLKQRMVEELGDEDHVPDTLGNVEAFLNRWCEIIKTKKSQLEEMCKPLP